MIEVGWKSPEIAAKIANTLRDVFVSNQWNVRQSSAVLEVRDLRSRIDELRARLKAIDDKLGEFSDTSGLVDLDKETQNYLAELSSAELLYDQARADQQSIEMQIRSARQMLARAQPAGSPKAEPLGDLNMRATRLQNAIHEDQTVRAAQADLEGLRILRDQKLALYKEGLAPKLEYDKAEAAYQAQKERAVDTSQVKDWRAEISQLDEGILPAGRFHRLLPATGSRSCFNWSSIVLRPGLKSTSSGKRSIGCERKSRACPNCSAIS